MIKKGMNRNRTSVSLDNNLLPGITAYWILGFVEAEGTFGIKGLSPYFQVAQHAKSVLVLHEIKDFFK